MKELTAARPTPTPRKWEHATAPVMPIRTQSMPISAETNKGRAPCSRPLFQLWPGGSPDEGLHISKTLEAEPRD